MAQTVNVNFHQTFRPEKKYISALLEIAEDNEFLSLKEISATTGIPTGESSGKVEPHIFYANYMGLIDYEKKNGLYQLKRTAIGEVVYAEDPGLQENLTILLCHCLMQRQETGAPVWSYIFKKVLPLYKNGIKKDLVIKELEKPFDGKITQKNIAPFYGSYDSFFDLNLLEDTGNEINVNALSINKEYIYIYAVTLFSYWDEKYPEQDEITSLQLEDLHYKDVFGWDAQTEYETLELMSDREIIRLNRQLMPYTLLKLVDKEQLILKLYSELC